MTENYENESSFSPTEKLRILDLYNLQINGSPVFSVPEIIEHSRDYVGKKLDESSLNNLLAEMDTDDGFDWAVKWRASNIIRLPDYGSKSNEGSTLLRYAAALLIGSSIFNPALSKAEDGQINPNAVQTRIEYSSSNDHPKSRILSTQGINKELYNRIKLDPVIYARHNSGGEQTLRGYLTTGIQTDKNHPVGYKILDLSHIQNISPLLLASKTPIPSRPGYLDLTFDQRGKELGQQGAKKWKEGRILDAAVLGAGRYISLGNDIFEFIVLRPGIGVLGGASATIEGIIFQNGNNFSKGYQGGKDLGAFLSDGSPGGGGFDILSGGFIMLRPFESLDELIKREGNDFNGIVKAVEIAGWYIVPFFIDNDHGRHIICRDTGGPGQGGPSAGYGGGAGRGGFSARYYLISVAR